jgi:Ser/Thr protein kinase RdoA (MazF antagonist)
MNYFPVISSNLSGPHLALLLQENYGMASNATCTILKAGINHSYKVTAGGEKYVFRVYAFGWRSKAEIKEELKLLNLLKEKGISLSYPMPDQSGNYIQQINAPEGLRYGVLFSFAAGEKAYNYSPETHYVIGRIMGQIHQATMDLKLDRPTYNAQTILIDSFEELKSFLPADTEEMTFMASAQSFLLNEFANADTTKLRQGIVHLDIWFDNLNIDKEGKVTLFDFDFCGNGWLCLDLAYYIMQVYSTEKEENERNIKVEHFLMGYKSASTISEEEKRLIPMLGVSLYFFYLGVQSKRYDDWANVFLNEAHLKRYINLLVKKYFDERKLGNVPAATTTQ